MKVITCASSKGGVGKTTLTSALAVRAARDGPNGKRVAMVDLDPQSSLADWWKRRGRTENPTIFTGADKASEAIEKLELTERPDFVFIDTPPAFLVVLQDAIESADLAVIPLKASALDLIASEDAVMMAREAGVSHLCVINDADPRWKTTHSARDYLLAADVPVADAIITHRQPYLGAMSYGKTGPEIERKKKGEAKSATEAEIDALWDEVKRALGKAKRKETAHG